MPAKRNALLLTLALALAACASERTVTVKLVAVETREPSAWACERVNTFEDTDGFRWMTCGATPGRIGDEFRAVIVDTCDAPPQLVIRGGSDASR